MTYREIWRLARLSARKGGYGRSPGQALRAWRDLIHATPGIRVMAEFGPGGRFQLSDAGAPAVRPQLVPDALRRDALSR